MLIGNSKPNKVKSSGSSGSTIHKATRDDGGVVKTVTSDVKEEVFYSLSVGCQCLGSALPARSADIQRHLHGGAS